MAVITNKCKFCEQSFSANRKDAVYCSLKCKKASEYARKPLIEVLCVHCGIHFKSKKKSQYCSKKCINEGAKKHDDVELVCKECNGMFTRKFIHRDRLFCSKSCSTKNQNKEMFADDKIKNKISETKKKQYKSGERIHPWKGKHHSDETKEKISKFHLENETFKGENNPMFGKKHSIEAKQKISETRTEKILSGEYDTWFKKGTFYSKKNNLLLSYQSSWEQAAIIFLEKDKNVLSFITQPFSILYFNGYQNRNYIPDLLISYADGVQKLIEIKPKCFLEAQINKAKFEAARQYCQEKGIIFEVWTEETIETFKHQHILET